MRAVKSFAETLSTQREAETESEYGEEGRGWGPEQTQGPNFSLERK